MASSELKISWFDDVFENDQLGKSLSELKQEFDTLIQKSMKAKKDGLDPEPKILKDGSDTKKLQSKTPDKNLCISINDSKKLIIKPITNQGKLNKAKSVSRFFYQSSSNLSRKKMLKSNISLQNRKSSARRSFFANKKRRKSTVVTSQPISSQLPKPVEGIEVETDDHYFVPPVVKDGEIVTNFQYLTLHDTDKLFSDQLNSKPKKKRNYLRQTSQDLSNAITKIVKKNQITSKDEPKKTLEEVYNQTFNIEIVKDLYNKNKKKSLK